jgi:spermidine synthase
VWTALALSGVAGLVNQVVWQRALKIFLGGSETLSAMVVVLVFMGGLGLGSALAGRSAERWPRPLAALAAVEGALGLVTAAVAVLLGLDVSETVYAVQRTALSLGLPLRAVYAVGAGVLLLPPTLLMGATLPLASESLQRQLGADDAKLVPALFVVNTLGAAAGGLLASLYLLPLVGQRRTLLLAVACNLAAAALLSAAQRGLGAAAVADAPADASPAPSGLRFDEGLGFALGLLALGYEMVLFRVLALAHEPLPTTFAMGLCAFLVAWSTGVALAGRLPGLHSVPGLAAITAATLAPLGWLYERDLNDEWTLLTGLLVYSTPVIGFGLLYGNVVTRAAEAWGRDVGRYAAANTLGSCVGIVAFTLVGHELPLVANGWVLAAGMGAVAAADAARSGRVPTAVGWSLVAAQLLGAVGVVGWGASQRYTESGPLRVYWGRDGVVEVTQRGNVYIDGLWHTKLTDGDDHIGRPYSWLMAATAVMAHGDDPERALVIGAGVGISGVTLEGLEGLQIDGYEINHTLRRVLEDYPAETLGALDHPRIRWIWRDARTGLALDPTRYDVILSAPLHLRQAGSSLLLSTEYLRLVKSRLTDDGVLAVYSNEGSEAQTLLVQRTVAEHFRYQVTWYDGVVTLASDRPIHFTADDLQARMQRDDRLYRELAQLDARLRSEGYDQGVFSWYDGPLEGGMVADRPITDDQPLVEYPELAAEVVRPVPRASVR